MQITEVDTREGYNKWAETYDSNGNPLVALEDQAFMQLIGAVSGLTAIDLGCGTGRNTIKLDDLGAKVTGVDLSEGMLSKAKENSGNRDITYFKTDLTKPTSFEDNQFDLVTSSLVIEHVQHLTPLFQEMGRICKKQGSIFISDLHPAMKLKDAQAQFTDRQTGKDIRPKGYPHSMAEYMLAIRDSDLKLVDVREYSGDEDLVAKYPKMAKYVGWPMLVVFKVSPN